MGPAKRPQSTPGTFKWPVVNYSFHPLLLRGDSAIFSGKLLSSGRLTSSVAQGRRHGYLKVNVISLCRSAKLCGGETFWQNYPSHQPPSIRAHPYLNLDRYRESSLSSKFEPDFMLFSLPSKFQPLFRDRERHLSSDDSPSSNDSPSNEVFPDLRTQARSTKTDIKPRNQARTWMIG